MKIKKEVKERLEKAFTDAEFEVKLDFNIHAHDLITPGKKVPVCSLTEIDVTATVPLKESDLELE